MRRSSYAGTPSPAKDYHKGMRKKIKKSNHTNISNSPNNSEKNSPSNYITDPQILSYYFLLFMAQKRLASITQRKYLTRFFREWQHHFTSSVLKNLSNSSNRQTRSLNQISKKLLHSQGTQIMTPNYSINNHPQIQSTDSIDNHPQIQSKNSLNNHPQIQSNSTPKQEEPLHVDKQLKSFENSSFSPKSPSLIATLSPKEENNSDFSSFSIDDVLNFSDNQKSSRKNEVSSLFDPIYNFVPSDEFDQINEKTSTSPNYLNTHKTNYHLLAETLPDDLFSSESSRIEKPQSQTEIKINQNQDLTKSPIRMDEELMIQAALADEFVRDHKSKPKKKKRRKIIIVREYSDSDNDEDEVYEYYSRSPSTFSKGNKSSINQKYTFSDESFSDEKTNLSSTIEMSKSELNSKSKSIQTGNFELNDSFEEINSKNKIISNEKHSDLNENSNSDEIEIENSFSNENENDYHNNYNEDEDKGIYRIVGQNSSDEIDFLIRDTDDNQIGTDRKNDDFVDYSEDEF